MREIKFRAWNGKETWMLRVIETDCDDILMQYTELKDKNGTEIYEGDILENPYIWTEDGNNIYGVVKFGECTVASGEYSAYGFYLETNDGEIVRKELITPNYVRGIEVKGNIYENPELLAQPTN